MYHIILKKTEVQFAVSHESGKIFKSADFSGQTKRSNTIYTIKGC